MRSITYLDPKNNQVRKQWSEAISGVVVLWLAEDNIYIEELQMFINSYVMSDITM